MSFIDNVTDKIPFLAKPPKLEYFFALNIGPEKLTTALWTIDRQKLKILGVAAGKYRTEAEIVSVTDKLLDATLGIRESDPEKILFGVPDSWLQDENLKEPYLKLLRQLVKELEVKPMAYVSTSHAIAHFLEKEENSPMTAILVGVGEKYVNVMVLKAGKVEATTVVVRGNELGIDIQNALITFTDIEVLPSKLLIYGSPADTLNKLKNQLQSFSWMTKLSFLHLPRIEILSDNMEIKSVTLAGGVEINPNVQYDQSSDLLLVEKVKTNSLLEEDDQSLTQNKEPLVEEKQSLDQEVRDVSKEDQLEEDQPNEDFGFAAGDVMERVQPEVEEELEEETAEVPSSFKTGVSDNFETVAAEPAKTNNMANEERNFTKQIGKFPTAFLHPVLMNKAVIGIIVVLVVLIAGYIFLPHAKVTIYIEPKTLEKDAQVTADPNVKEVDQQNNKIPGQLVETQVSGTGTGTATGTKQIGDPAKGTIKIINNTDQGISFAQGTVLTTVGGLKFTLDDSASVSATEADADSKSTVNATVTAVVIGADGNIPTETNLTIGDSPTSQVVAKSEGNFAGGTSKQVTVISADDQQKLLSAVTDSIHKKAQGDLQSSLGDKKILPETFTDQVIKKSFNKAVGDQSSDFTLDLTLKLNGLAFSDTDLKTIVAKLVQTNVPDNYVLDIADSETQADVSKVNTDGTVEFLARFTAKLMPKIDTDTVISQIKGKTVDQAQAILRSYESVLDSDIQITPAIPLPGPLNRLPFIGKNISVDVTQK